MKRLQMVVFAAILLAGAGLSADATCPVEGPECRCGISGDYPVINCVGLGRVNKFPSFTDVPKTYKWLHVGSDTQLDTLKNDSFKHLKVRDLWLVGMELETIEDEAFKGLEDTLEELHLGFNHLTSLKGLKSLNNLKELSLVSNRISRISKSDFAPFADTLRMLDLSRNRLGDLSGVFKSLKNLIQLRLRGCSLVTLDPTAFAPDMRLSSLELSQNEMTEVPVAAISQLKHLEEINLASNRIKEVRKHAFADLGSLRVIDLSINSLGQIESEAFVNLTSLKRLKLNRNRIKGNITNDMFVNVNNLRTLDLSNNEIIAMADPYPNLGMRTLVLLSSNQFRCDCNIAWIRHYSAQVLGSSQQCKSPPEYLQRRYDLLNFPAPGCPVPTTPAPTPAGSSSLAAQRLLGLLVTGVMSSWIVCG